MTWERVPLTEVTALIREFDPLYGGRLSGVMNYSRVVSLSWFHRSMSALRALDQDSVGIVSGSADEPELRLLRPANVTVLAFDGTPRFDLDRSWADQPGLNFSLTVCNQVLEHVFDPHLAFRNLLHHTRSRGLVYLTIPTVNCIHGEPHFYSAGYHPRFLERLAKQHDLEILGIGAWGTPKYLLHAVSGTWLPSALLGPGYHSAADFRLPSLVFSDGRDPDCPVARAMGFGDVITDCWALFRKR
jgi:SAM-dependent methyltransferase